jgi:hypothetical protein
MSLARYQSMARQIDRPCGHLRVRRQEHSSQLFQPTRLRQPTQQDCASFEQLHWPTPHPLDKRIGRLRHLNSHVIVPADLCARGRDRHHAIEESALKDEARRGRRLPWNRRFCGLLPRILQATDHDQLLRGRPERIQFLEMSVQGGKSPALSLSRARSKVRHPFDKD